MTRVVQTHFFVSPKHAGVHTDMCVVRFVNDTHADVYFIKFIEICVDIQHMRGGSVEAH